MASETRVDEELFAMVWFGELEEEDAGGEVVDVGQSQRDEAGGEFVGDDLDVEGGEALFHAGQSFLRATAGASIEKRVQVLRSRL